MVGHQLLEGTGDEKNHYPIPFLDQHMFTNACKTLKPFFNALPQRKNQKSYPLGERKNCTHKGWYYERRSPKVMILVK